MTPEPEDSAKNWESVRDVVMEEWRTTRQLSETFLQSIWYKEVTALAAIAVFYGWYFTQLVQHAEGAEAAGLDRLLWLPVLVLPLLAARLVVEYAVLMRLSLYQHALEEALYTGSRDVKLARSKKTKWYGEKLELKVDGRTAFQAQNRPKPSICEVVGRYPQTFIIILLLWLLSAWLACYGLKG